MEGNNAQANVNAQLEEHKNRINEQMEEMKQLKATIDAERIAVREERERAEQARADAHVDRQRGAVAPADANAGEESHTTVHPLVIAKQTCKHVGCYYGVNGTPTR